MRPGLQVLPISSRDNRAYLAGVHRFAVESSGIGGGGGASARLPCWLNIRVARIGRGFHGLSNGRAAPRGRGNPGDARGADRGGASDGPAGPGAGRHAGYARHGHRRHGRARHRDFRKPPNPGRPTAAISSPAALAVPQNSFSRRRHAECALRHRWLARRHHDQRRGTHRSVHGSKRANSGHRRDRACRETGEARARLPASGRPGSRGRGAGPGDDHPDDHPHQLEWTRRAADRI